MCCPYLSWWLLTVFKRSQNGDSRDRTVYPQVTPFLTMQASPANAGISSQRWTLGHHRRASVSEGRPTQPNTRRSPCVGLMLGHRRRRWTNIKPIQFKRVLSSWTQHDPCIMDCVRGTIYFHNIFIRMITRLIDWFAGSADCMARL